jgi:ribonuclease P protein component
MDSGQTFQKRERIVSQILMEQLFDGISGHSLTAFPLRAVFMAVPRTEKACPVQILISVPKRRLKHAVDRNRVKRQVREAYRLNKQLLWNSVPNDRQLAVAFIWLAHERMPTPRVTHSITTLLTKIGKGLHE